MCEDTPSFFPFLLFTLSFNSNYMITYLILNVTGNDRYGWFRAKEQMLDTCS